MGSAVNRVTDAVGLTDSDAAEKAIGRGVKADVKGRKKAADYLIEADRLPREFREAGLMRLGDAFGFGEEGAQEAFYDSITENPLYANLLEGREEAFLRNQSATGDLRGGASIAGVGRVENEVFRDVLGNELQGIQALMSGPDYTRDIANAYSGIGQVQGQGLIAQGQARQNADQAGFNNLLGVLEIASKTPTGPTV